MKYYGPRHKVLGKFTPEDILPYISEEETYKEYTGKDGNIYKVRMNSDRYYVFSKNRKCACCGLEGKVFLLEVPSKRRPHFNFYAKQNGYYILMTKDHVIPLGKNGDNERYNLQTMCCICNNLKADDLISLDDLRNKRKVFDHMNLLSLKCVASTSHIYLYLMDYLHNGQKGRWIFASRSKKGLVEAQKRGRKPLEAQAVLIIACIGDRIVVTKEFRPPLGDYEHSFPAGLIDTGESVYEAATRELFEETGLGVVRFHGVVPQVFSTSGMTDESVSLVFCDAIGKVTNQNLQDDEDINVLLLSREETKALLLSKDAKIGGKAWGILFSWANGIEFSGKFT